jgi:hypothetical protein
MEADAERNMSGIRRAVISHIKVTNTILDAMRWSYWGTFRSETQKRLCYLASSIRYKSAGLSPSGAATHFAVMGAGVTGVGLGALLAVDWRTDGPSLGRI